MSESGEKKEHESSKDSEDVEIDFSKITGLFKKKKEQKHAEHGEPLHHGGDSSEKKHETSEHERREAGDDEIDLGKALKGFKGFFRGGKPEKSDDDSVDTAAIFSFAKKNHVTLLMILGILVSVWLG